MNDAGIHAVTGRLPRGKGKFRGIFNPAQHHFDATLQTDIGALIVPYLSCYRAFVTVISIPCPLREKLGDDGADALVDLLSKVNDGTRQDIMTIVEEKFERRLAAVEATLVKWMFIFWVGQIGVITGILFAFFKR